MTKITARAHTNIALIKYWGKRDEQLFLPMNSSLSLTLDSFYTDTTLSRLEDAESDYFYLNGQLQSPMETEKVSRFCDLFRQASHLQDRFLIESTNHVPTAAGLASSASAYAALGVALNEITHLRLDTATLSTYVRQGSGSATRSLYGGFVEWQKGQDSLSSKAVEIDPADWDIGMLTLVVNGQEKKISSREGMARTVATSPFYPEWVATCTADLAAIKLAINQHDLEQVGDIMEKNSLKMHATMLSASPPFWYFQPETIRIMDKIQCLRRQGHLCYFTMDAGPNVKVLCRASEMLSLQTILHEEFPDLTILPSSVGSGARCLNERKFI